MPNPAPVRELCSVDCRKSGEPLFGTASRVDLWLIVEVPGPWADEVGASILPDSPLGRALLPVIRTVPRSRVLFIKGPAGPRESIAFYLAVSDELDPRLYHFELASYEALEGIDLFGVLAEDERYDAFREPRPLYLVCTHGTHDRCCAKFGFPTYRSMERREPELVWQSSHIGGDRFAANMVCLPYGVYYGQVEAEDVEALLESTAAGHLYPPRLRGRTCYPAPVQAAEWFLREAEGETSLSAYRLCSHSREGAVTTAAFLTEEDGALHTVRVEAIQLEGLRLLTCGSDTGNRVTTHRLVDHQVTPFQPETLLAGEVAYQLRPAAMRDQAFIYRLRRETLNVYLDEFEMPPEERGPFFAGFDVVRHRIISLDQRSVGAISVLEREGTLHLANLHLAPASQRCGLGTALVQDVQRRAAESGRGVTTQVLKNNPAVAFYQRLGFRIEGEQGRRYRMVWEA